MHILLLAIIYCSLFKNHLNSAPLVQPTTMSLNTDSSANGSENNDSTRQTSSTQSDEQEILALPSSISDEGVRQFTFGEKLSLDHLGPIIINTDGTTKRITNWDKLTEDERKTTWRVISTRNKKRLEELKSSEEQKEK